MASASFPSPGQLRSRLNSIPPDQEHLRQIAQAQFVAQPPEHHEGDDVGTGKVLSAVENPTATLIELLSTNTWHREAPVTAQAVRSGRSETSAASHSMLPHFPFPHPGGSYAGRALSGQSILARRMTEPTAMLNVCRKCGRRGRLRTARLLREHGPDTPVPELSRALVGKCPQVRSTDIYDRCDAYCLSLR